MKRQNFSSGAVWEETVGYSRAVRVGNTVEVAGTTATNGEEIMGKGCVYKQTRYVLLKIEKALQQAGATLQDVVRTRIFVTDISHWQEVGRTHGEFFRTIKPASTMVEIKALIHPDLLVEIEASAIIT
ncbi:RidA family protein [Pontibacter silvestris]|uniref:RidA family protein n=1 Tax=Pontibacter silvestris TaxID=2305183 RepID=A0ABW4WXQ6_9BACT|nr:RidA family protein [Pontibacter silvestris]MCC9136845.1 RidA family protein [Pontibacter silvestris]